MWRKNWLLSDLNEFDLDVNDEFPDIFSANLSPLLQAIGNVDDLLLLLLLDDCQADVGKDKQQAALILACAGRTIKSSASVQSLIDHGADTNAVDKGGLTALDYAVCKS